MLKATGAFFVSIRLNVITASGCSFVAAITQYSVVAICTRSLKNDDLPRGYGYPFSLEDSSGTECGPVLYAIPLV